MKKVLWAALVMLSMAAFASAGDLFSTPRGEPQALATADYGGVSYSTQAFPVSGTGANYSTACINSDSFTCTGVFYGVIFSSGSSTSYDFVDVYDSTSSDFAPNRLITRLYNVNGSTATGLGATGASNSGFSGPPKPIRFKLGLITRPSVASYNMITTQFFLHKENKGKD